MDNITKLYKQELTYYKFDPEVFRAKLLKEMNKYSEKHWQQIRLKALERDNYKCTLCDSNLNLEVHHKTYKNKGNERLNEIITLCRKCHKKIHS